VELVPEVRFVRAGPKIWRSSETAIPLFPNWRSASAFSCAELRGRRASVIVMGALAVSTPNFRARVARGALLGDDGTTVSREAGSDVIVPPSVIEGLVKAISALTTEKHARAANRRIFSYRRRGPRR
jgi:hypothetical protein